MAKLLSVNSIQTNIIYKDGYLISYGKDNIINIFNLKELDKFDKLPESYDDEILNGFSKTIGGNILEMLNDSDEELANGIKHQVKSNNFLYTPTPTQIRTYMKMFLSKKQVIIPTTSLYIKNEKDWIMYTPEGLFTYGGDGYKLLKYHQNQGLKKEAKIIENEKLFDKFYRPDLIKKILAGEKVSIPLDVKSVILNILPPELKILVNKMINEKDIELTYQVCDMGNGIADPKLIINGQAINPPTSRGFSVGNIKIKTDKCKIYKSIHTLDPGKNKIVFKAYDKDKNIANESKSLHVNTNYKLKSLKELELTSNKNKNATANANLYLFTIAVSNYESNSLDLEYSVKDAASIEDKILSKSNTKFKNIYTYNLYDNNVTKQSIENIFNKISKNIKYNDAFILYIAGHGTSKDGKYQFVPYRAKEVISIDDLKNNLSKIAVNKSLVLLDTCQSGSAIENINTIATKNRLAYDSAKINYIVSSSKDQVALEGYKGHGVFTYSVLNAFENAYFKDENQLYVYNLGKFIKVTVPKISKKYFKFEQDAQFKKARDFPIGIK